MIVTKYELRLIILACLVALVLLSLACSPGYASSLDASSAQPQPSTPKVSFEQFQAAHKAADRLDRLTNGESRALQFFVGPDGLIGIVGYNEKRDRKFVAWATQNGNALIIGPVIYRHHNLTSYYETHALDLADSEQEAVVHQGKDLLMASNTPDDSSSDSATDSVVANQPKTSSAESPFISSELFARVQSAPGVTLGDADKHLYMFYDEFCPYCSRGIRDLKHRIEHHDVMVTYIPVGILGKDSLKAAAAVLSAEDRVSAFKNKAGGQLAKEHYSDAAMRRAIQNSKLMSQLTPGTMATPTFVLVGAKDGQPYTVQGLPESMSDLVAGIAPVSASNAQAK